MNQTENINFDPTETEIEYAYKIKACMDYISCGSFEKDLDRARKILSNSKNKTFTNSKKDNPKFGTLIGKDLFFTALSDEKIIKKSDILEYLFLDKENKSNGVVFKFRGFNCLKKDENIQIYV